MTMRFLIALAFAAPLFGQTCTFVVNPTSFHISAAAFTGTVKVTQPPGCNLGNYSVTVPIETNWLHITSDATGTPGDAGVSFTADENRGATARAGIMSYRNAAGDRYPGRPCQLCLHHDANHAEHRGRRR